MKFVGIHTQISRNNQKSILLLIAFPLMILLGVYVVIFFLSGAYTQPQGFYNANQSFMGTVPVVLIVVAVWFVIAYFFHAKMIQLSTRSKPLERKENMRVYNLTENLCMSVGMPMPQLYVIDSEALNAFASGINEKTYAVTLTTGIINQLTDDELEGVIGHELTHIRNKDVRLLIITIVFVGIFAFVLDMAFRNMFGFGRISLGRNNRDKGSGGAIVIIVIVAAVLYFFAMIFKFALSRSREYMADAGAVELTRNPQALADALKKVSGNSELKTRNDEVKELFLENSKKSKKEKNFFSNISKLFASHPPIEKRIAILENYQ